MTKCLSEDWIELLAIDHTRDPAAVLPQHLQVCTHCRSAYESMLIFYKMVSAEIATFSTAATGDQQIEQVASQVCHTFLLHAMASDPELVAESTYQRVLAADSETPTIPKAQVTNRGVLATADGRLLVRLLEHPDGQVACYLLADTAELYQHVLVRILNSNREYVSDHTGYVNLGKIELPGLNELGIEVSTPTKRFDLKTLFLDSETLIGESEITLPGQPARLVKLQIYPAGTNYSLKVSLLEKQDHARHATIKVMVVRQDHPPMVHPSVKGVALFQELIDPRTIQVNIFE